MANFCPWCGEGVRVDEDGLCVHCGCTATGDELDKLIDELAQNEKLRRARRNAQRAIKAWRDLDHMGTRMASRKVELLEHDCQELRKRLAEVEREKDAERMRYGQQRARCATFMSAMAWLARNGQQSFAQKWVAAADKAAADVRPEDFVVAKVGGGR